MISKEVFMPNSHMQINEEEEDALKKVEAILKNIMNKKEIKNKSMELNFIKKLKNTKKLSKFQFGIKLMKTLVGSKQGMFNKKGEDKSEKDSFRGNKLELFDLLKKKLKQNKEDREFIEEKQKIREEIIQRKKDSIIIIRFKKKRKNEIVFPLSLLFKLKTLIDEDDDDDGEDEIIGEEKTKIPLIYSPIPFESTFVLNLYNYDRENYFMDPFEMKNKYNIAFKPSEILSSKIDCFPINTKKKANKIQFGKNITLNEEEALKRINLIEISDENDIFIPETIKINIKSTPFKVNYSRIEDLKNDYEEHKYENVKVIPNEEIDIGIIKSKEQNEEDYKFNFISDSPKKHIVALDFIISEKTDVITNSIFEDVDENIFDNIHPFLINFDYRNSSIKKLVTYLLNNFSSLNSILDVGPAQKQINNYESEIINSIGYLKKIIENEPNDYPQNMELIVDNVFKMINETITSLIKMKNDLESEKSLYDNEKKKYEVNVSLLKEYEHQKLLQCTKYQKLQKYKQMFYQIIEVYNKVDQEISDVIIKFKTKKEKNKNFFDSSLNKSYITFSRKNKDINNSQLSNHSNNSMRKQRLTQELLSLEKRKEILTEENKKLILSINKLKNDPIPVNKEIKSNYFLKYSNYILLFILIILIINQISL